MPSKEDLITSTHPSAFPTTDFWFEYLGFWTWFKSRHVGVLAYSCGTLATVTKGSPQTVHSQHPDSLSHSLPMASASSRPVGEDHISKQINMSIMITSYIHTNAFSCIIIFFRIVFVCRPGLPLPRFGPHGIGASELGVWSRGVAAGAAQKGQCAAAHGRFVGGSWPFFLTAIGLDL